MLYFRDRRGTAILVFEQRPFADSFLWRPKSYILGEHKLNNYLIAKKTNQQTGRQADNPLQLKTFRSKLRLNIVIPTYVQ